MGEDLGGTPGWRVGPNGSPQYWDGERWLHLDKAPLPGGLQAPPGRSVIQLPVDPRGPVFPQSGTDLPPTPRVVGKRRKLSIVAVALGLIAFFLAVVPVIGLLFAVAAVTVAIVAVASGRPRALSITGMTFASLGVVGGIVSSAVLVAALLGGPGNTPSASEGASGTRAGLSPQVGQPVGDSVVDAEINDAVGVVGKYWSDHFADFYVGRPYAAPRVAGAYTSDQLPSCGDQELLPSNAYYCPLDHTVGWDADLMKAAFDAGDAVIYLIVAHEWGHAIQAQNGDVWVAAELQADCFAAAALYGAERDGHFMWEAGDTAEITHAMTELADETAWTDTSDHGDPLDRIDAFNDGRVAGAKGCRSIDD